MIVVVAALNVGCSYSAGVYFADRGRDFAQCFRMEVRVGLGVGGGVRAAGIADVGVLASTGGRLGWAYGEWHVFGESIDDWLIGSQIDLMLPGATLQVGDRWARSAGIPSALWSQTLGKNGRAWIWRRDGATLEKIHACDVEVYAHAGIIGVVLGFSPGQFIDFVLGWFGLDIAGDDHLERTVSKVVSFRASDRVASR